MKSLTNYINEQLEKSNENPTIQENIQASENTEQVAENSNNQETVQEDEQPNSKETTKDK